MSSSSGTPLSKPPLHPSRKRNNEGSTTITNNNNNNAGGDQIDNSSLPPIGRTLSGNAKGLEHASQIQSVRNLAKGSLVWVKDSEHAWVKAIVSVIDKEKDVAEVMLESSKQVISASVNDMEICNTNPGDLVNVDDLTNIPVLHEPVLLAALEERFQSNIIYTTTGPILIAVNPFMSIPSLYGENVAKAYFQLPGSEGSKDLDPHPYLLANAAYHSMMEHNGCNQSILVSGESGAGKTETTKIVMSFLSYASSIRSNNSSNSHHHHQNEGDPVSKRVLQANPLLEALGNAKTIRNDNSSRFGKLIRLCFDPKNGRLLGANFATYLLETPRCCEQNPKERNYHIFYELIASCSDSDRSRWHLPSQGHEHETFRYLNSDGQKVVRADIDDSKQFETTRFAMDTLGFTKDERYGIMDTVMAIMHLGNITFNSHDAHAGSVIDHENCSQHLKALCSLLGLENLEAFEKSLTSKTIRLVNEELTKHLNCHEAGEARDALAMSLYERLFGWTVWRVNESIAGEASEFIKIRAATRRNSSSVSSIGTANSFGSTTSSSNRIRTGSTIPGIVHEKKEKKASQPLNDYETAILDIFGFEVFEKNSFEQLCINYANEQLQVQFNEYVFELEQIEYTHEGIDWAYVEFPDNSKCVEMIEGRPIGLLSLLDEVCLMQGNSDVDKSLASKLYENLPTRFEQFTVNAKLRAEGKFAIRHFAGDVIYICKGFPKKNKNQLHDDVIHEINQSSHWLVSKLLGSDSSSVGMDHETFFTMYGVRGPDSEQLQETSSISKVRSGDSIDSSVSISKRRSQLQQVTVGTHFKSQLNQAMALIRASSPHFIRCLKPNDRNTRRILNRSRMASQLRYSGVLEVVKITRAGYSSRFHHSEFLSRYEILLGGRPGLNELKKSNSSIQKAVQVALQKLNLQEFSEYQIGKTKVFLRQSACVSLDSRKIAILELSTRVIQDAYRVYRFRKGVREAKMRREMKLREERELADKRLRIEREQREEAERLQREEEERKNIALYEARLAAEKAEQERLWREQIAENERLKKDAAKVIHVYLRPWVRKIREERAILEKALEAERLKQEEEEMIQSMDSSKKRIITILSLLIPELILVLLAWYPPEPRLVGMACFILIGIELTILLIKELMKHMPTLISFRKKERSAKEIAQLRRKTVKIRQSLGIRHSLAYRASVSKPSLIGNLQNPELRAELEREYEASVAMEQQQQQQQQQRRQSQSPARSPTRTNSTSTPQVNPEALKAFAQRHSISYSLSSHLGSVSELEQDDDES